MKGLDDYIVKEEIQLKKVFQKSNNIKIGNYLNITVTVTNMRLQVYNYTSLNIYC